MSKAHTCLVGPFAHECFTSRGSGGSNYENESFCFMFPLTSIFLYTFIKKQKEMHLCLSLAIPLDILQCVCVVYMRQDNGLFVYLPFDTGPPSPID